MTSATRRRQVMEEINDGSSHTQPGSGVGRRQQAGRRNPPHMAHGWHALESSEASVHSIVDVNRTTTSRRDFRLCAGATA